MAIPPVYTVGVNQQFFIESQGGAKQAVSYLDRFPEAVYSKAIDSVLVTFLYALLGPVGVGQIKQEYLEARLKIEDAGLSTVDLDALYTSPFAFARLAEETYDIDANASLLTSQQRAQILAGDASFRNRAILFLKGIRAGGTQQGIALVAESGLNHPVDVIENYKALWDQYSDAPLGLPIMGSTTNMNEIIILPRQDVPQSAQQTLIITGEPTSGFFTLSYPAGADYQTCFVSTVSGSPIVTVPDATKLAPGMWISITSSTTTLSSAPNPTTYAEIGTIVSPTTVSLVRPHGDAGAGDPWTPTSFNMSATGTFWAYVANARTIRLPWDAASDLVQSALWALPVLGIGNVSVSGGPLPDQPMVVSFTNDLADTPVPTLQFNTNPDTVSGIGAIGSTSPPLVVEMGDVTGNPINIVGDTTVGVVGISADSQQNNIAPLDQHAMEIAVDQIRPQTSFVTTRSATNTTVRQKINNTFTSPAMTEVLGYVTGSSAVSWPADSIHWIESGREHEAPRPLNTGTQSYRGFHNLPNMYAYTEAALLDPYYSDPTGATGPPIWIQYYNTMAGTFSQAQLALMPVLAKFQNPDAQYPVGHARAASPDPLVITNTVNGVGILNYNYPADYLSLSGVRALPTGLRFYSSMERNSGTDYIEIDLGTVQAVNFIYFEATGKPYSIDVAYDTLDLTPARSFQPVSYAVHIPSVTSIAYTQSTNPWKRVTMYVCNTLGKPIYTRHVRIGLTRIPGSTPYAPADNKIIPYGIEIRNLRIGRTVS